MKSLLRIVGTILLTALLASQPADARLRKALLATPPPPVLDLNFMTGSLPGNLTFTRASTGWDFNSAGLLTSAGNNVPRFDYNPATGALNGLLLEQASTNLELYGRDWTQTGSWTATNITTAKNATGIDGAANAATTLTASAGNGTILQSITNASSATTKSVYIKRVTGTGEIDLTLNGASGWTSLTSSNCSWGGIPTAINTSTWTRCQVEATQTNPSVGIRIVTNGDAVIVDAGQTEGLSFATSPILTTSGAVTRAADVASITTTAFPFNPNAGTILINVINEGVEPSSVYSRYLSLVGSNANTDEISLYDSGTNNNPAGAVTVGETTSSSPTVTNTTWAVNSLTKAAYSYNAVSTTISANGGAPFTAAVTAGLPAIVGLDIMGAVRFQTQPSGWVQRVRYWNYQLPNSRLQYLSSPGAP